MECAREELSEDVGWDGNLGKRDEPLGILSLFKEFGGGEYTLF